MGWSVGQSDDKDLESMSANYPSLRLISVPQFGTREAQKDFKGQWEATTPETAINFSAVGYFPKKTTSDSECTCRTDR